MDRIVDYHFEITKIARNIAAFRKRFRWEL